MKIPIIDIAPDDKVKAEHPVGIVGEFKPIIHTFENEYEYSMFVGNLTDTEKALEQHEDYKMVTFEELTHIDYDSLIKVSSVDLNNSVLASLHDEKTNLIRFYTLLFFKDEKKYVATSSSVLTRQLMNIFHSGNYFDYKDSHMKFETGQSKRKRKYYSVRIIGFG